MIRATCFCEMSRQPGVKSQTLMAPFYRTNSKEALWDKFYTAAPPRRRQSVEQYKIKRYGINQKTVAKWKQRETVADLPTGPKEAKSTVLSIEEEAIIVPIRLPCRRCSPNGFTRSPERHTEGR